MMRRRRGVQVGVMPSPFHAGETAIQEREGVREHVEPWARRALRPFMPQQHRDFYEQLPFIVVAARDAKDRPWLTMLSGPPGFIRSPEATSLLLDAEPLPGDALSRALIPGAEIGMLGIELHTRRRNRVNGTIVGADDVGLHFGVVQSFGNCPQYISQRDWQYVDVVPEDAKVSHHTSLTREMQRWIKGADTFFIASGYRGEGESPAFGMDASHRGGPPGFVQLLDDKKLVFPDYAGNKLFNTIGNLSMDPRVGLLFVDFASGALLQITGRAEIDWDSDEIQKHPGARRLVSIDIEAIVLLQDALPLRWSESEGRIRHLQLVERQQESDDVTSFVLAARDGGALPPFVAGQHLPIQLSIDGQLHKRTYSLSNAPSKERYRMSVKREPLGIVSRALHDCFEVGDGIAAQTPQGDFVLIENDRPVVLLSAGIGVTPVLSMLHSLRDDHREVFFFHGARDGAHHPMKCEVQTIVDECEHIHAMIAYSQPHDVDIHGKDFDHIGRINGESINQWLPHLDAEFYLCGPKRFLGDLQAQLHALGVDEIQIHTEEF